MKILCMKCFEVYRANLNQNYCPKEICSGELAAVDEMILPIIVILNKKGYYTSHCCSGHLYGNLYEVDMRKGAEIYISFDDAASLPNVPIGWKILGSTDQQNSLKGIQIRETYDRRIKPSILERQKQMFDALNDLLEWAMMLRPLDEDEKKAIKEEIKERKKERSERLRAARGMDPLADID